MGVSYNRLWKQLIDKNMKRIEMQHITGINSSVKKLSYNVPLWHKNSSSYQELSGRRN